MGVIESFYSILGEEDETFSSYDSTDVTDLLDDDIYPPKSALCATGMMSPPTGLYASSTKTSTRSSSTGKGLKLPHALTPTPCEHGRGRSARTNERSTPSKHV